MDNRHIKISLTLLAIIFSLNLVLALGVNAPYWKNFPLKMSPGETKSIEFILENSVSEKKDAIATITLLDSQGISEITSQTGFIIPPGSKDNKVIIKISVPNDAEIGKTYNIKFSVKSEEQKKEGTVQIKVGYDVEFPVLVVERSEQKNASKTNFSIIIAIIIILVIAIAFYLYKKFK